MRMEANQVEVVRSENFESMKFGIQDIKTIMHIMRNKMYTNPIRTMLQEVMTNARDANIEAGNKDPITVILPTNDNPTVTIKDTGLGMSKDLIRNIYVNYGSSTKRNTELQTGGYGLGAKSPFAYQDMFHIITTVTENGVTTKYKYCAFIGADGIGDLNLIESEVTTNPTGTSIIIPVEISDMGKIIDYVRELPKYWTIAPKLFNDGESWGVDAPPLPVNTVGNVLFFDKTTYSSPSHGLLVDKIHYHINLNRLFSGETTESIVDKYDIPEQDAQRIKNLLSNSYQNLMFDYNNGDIELSPNREEILYNDKNKRKIFWSICDLITKLLLTIQSEIDACPTYLQACRMFFGDHKYHKLNWIYNKDLEYKGHKLLKKIACKVQYDAKGTRYAPAYNSEPSKEKVEYLRYTDHIFINKDQSKRYLSQMEEIKKTYKDFVIVKRFNPVKVGPVDVTKQPMIYTFDNWLKDNEFWLTEIGYKYLEDVEVPEKDRKTFIRRLPTLDVYSFRSKSILSDVKVEDETPIYIRKCNDKYLLCNKEFNRNDVELILRFFATRFKKDIVVLKKSITKKHDTTNWTLLDDLIIPECEKIVNSKLFDFHVANANKSISIIPYSLNKNKYRQDPIMRKIFRLERLKYNTYKMGTIMSILRVFDFHYEIKKDQQIDVHQYIYQMYPEIAGVEYIRDHYTKIKQGRAIPKTNFAQNKNLKRRRQYV